MSWKKYNNMDELLEELPDGDEQDSGHSTPNIYGKAMQFFIALREARKDMAFTTGEVRLWRGLLTLLALQRFGNYPLRWERVTIPGGNTLLNDALNHPPVDSEILLFPNHPEWHWDGSTFYVLTWESEGKPPIDILLYSPITLVYPVADWQNVYQSIDPIKRFFLTGPGKEPEQMLNGLEAHIVYRWLENLRVFFEAALTEKNTRKNENSAQSVILRQVTRFQDDLQVSLNHSDHQGLQMCDLPGAGNAMGGFVPPLKQSVYVSIGDSADGNLAMERKFFADQLCITPVSKI